MSAASELKRRPLAEGARGEPDAGVLFVREVPRPVLIALAVSGAELGLSRSEYVRKVLARHVSDRAPFPEAA